jgi:hypothetical protein
MNCSIRFACLLLLLPVLASAAEETVSEFHETFEPIDLKRFTGPIPNKYTEVRDGVLWTRGSTGTPYPPMVFMPVEGKDLAISFRYRHLGEGGWLWFFVDGDDSFGSVDHLLRIKLLRDQIQLEVDGHSLDPDHPQRQKTKPVDPVSKAYRLNEFLPPHKIDLAKNDWHTVTAEFHGEEVVMTLDGMTWKETLKRPYFNAAKRKLLFMQQGGDAGIEIDDVKVSKSKPS